MFNELKKYWYLVCPSKELSTEIKKFKIFNIDIILYRDSSGNAVALEDRCCHRNVNLSLGYKKGDNLVCGYHGWEYNCEGSCVHIPSQLDDAKIPPKAQIKKFPIIDFNNWIWIYAGNPEDADKTKPLNIDQMKSWPFTYGEHIFQADLESTAESLIDPYHIAFTHKNSIGSFLGQIEDKPADFNIEFVEDGIIGNYKRANRGNTGEKIYFGNQEYHVTNFRFYFPNFALLHVNFKEKSLVILEHFMPVDNDTVSMTQITLWKNIFPKFPWFAKKFMKRKSDKIVKEDIVFLTSQKRIYDNPDIDSNEVSVKGDEVSLSFRKFWRRKINGSDNT